ncbi:lipoprotein-releasing system ATP-binding protein [Cetobacterium ceti]|uniref:Lipoprotein-releasing system ATP-binding protein n=1 Tax=Cetobacterium ceti TaxID=180163 RepID=A0A1T4KS25_9FUSO|nr:ABC transporter ATP-binding protein [Cetobacterium ceti]SJZ45239.1 lipoprotein-releasing system ATP-binding protein [Cetobacterium ceti]
MNKIILKLENLNKKYSGNVDNLHIIRDLNLEVNEGDFISILGKSGSGKSTLLNLIGMLDKPDSGKIFIDGEEVEILNEEQLDLVKNKKLGFVFQFHYLLPEFTALENVMLPGLVSDYKNKKRVEERAYELLKEVGMDHRMTHKPMELSGGEKQRVAIARALMNSPKILLMDEPTGNLDEETSEMIHKLLKKINLEKKQTIIVVTHSKELANLSNKKLYLKKGVLDLEENNHI